MRFFCLFINRFLTKLFLEIGSLAKMSTLPGGAAIPAENLNENSKVKSVAQAIEKRSKFYIKILDAQKNFHHPISSRGENLQIFLTNTLSNIVLHVYVLFYEHVEIGFKFTIASNPGAATSAAYKFPADAKTG